MSDESGHMTEKERAYLEAKKRPGKTEKLALANDLPLKTVRRILAKEKKK